MIRYISFDLDGTLADEDIDTFIWNEEIPRLYSEKHNVSLAEAKRFVYSEYYTALYIEKIKNWTDIKYWFKRFGLINLNKLLSDMKKQVFIYDDTLEILKYLSKNYRLIVISNAPKTFLKMKLEIEGISKYFDHVFSAPDDFKVSKKNKVMFETILVRLKIKSGQIIHVGNEYYRDYEVPFEAGIKSYHLVRSKEVKNENTIHSLLDLKKIL